MEFHRVVQEFAEDGFHRGGVEHQTGTGELLQPGKSQALAGLRGKEPFCQLRQRGERAAWAPDRRGVVHALQDLQDRRIQPLRTGYRIRQKEGGLWRQSS